MKLNAAKTFWVALFILMGTSSAYSCTAWTVYNNGNGTMTWRKVVDTHTKSDSDCKVQCKNKCKATQNGYTTCRYTFQGGGEERRSQSCY